jgi:hypothetical protein
LLRSRGTRRRGVTAQVYAGITEHGRETAAAKLTDAQFGR